MISKKSILYISALTLLLAIIGVGYFLSTKNSQPSTTINTLTNSNGNDASSEETEKETEPATNTQTMASEDVSAQTIKKLPLGGSVLQAKNKPGYEYYIWRNNEIAYSVFHNKEKSVNGNAEGFFSLSKIGLRPIAFKIYKVSEPSLESFIQNRYHEDASGNGGYDGLFKLNNPGSSFEEVKPFAKPQGVQDAQYIKIGQYGSDLMQIHEVCYIYFHSYILEGSSCHYDDYSDFINSGAFRIYKL